MRTRQDWCVIALGILGSLAAPVSGAPLFSVIIQRDTVYKQIGPGAPTTPFGLDIFLKADPPGSFDGGTVNTPGTAGTVSIVPSTDGAGNPDLSFGSGLISNQTTFNTMFPTGTYTFHLTDSADTTQNTTQALIDNSTGTFPPIPALSGASYTGLQGLDPTHAFTVFFNQFDTTNTVAGELGFFFIVNKATSATVFFDAPQPTTTQENIPANTLLPGTQYLFALFFTTNSSGGTKASNTQLQVNSETQGLFTTAGGVAAVPEPGSVFLCLLGLGAVAAVGRRRRGANR